MDPLVILIIGLVGGGIISFFITWGVARAFYHRQHRDDEEMMGHLVDAIAEKLVERGIVKVGQEPEVRKLARTALEEFRRTRLLRALDAKRVPRTFKLPRRMIVGGRIVDSPEEPGSKELH